MTKLITTLKLAGLTALIASLSLTAAEAADKRVRKACWGDYDSFCSQYDPGSSQVARCFESNRKNLSKGCIRALVDAGEVPAKYLKK